MAPSWLKSIKKFHAFLLLDPLVIFQSQVHGSGIPIMELWWDENNSWNGCIEWALMFADQIVFVSYLSEIFISRNTFPTPTPRPTPIHSRVKFCVAYLGFSYFKFKIRLIKLDFSFQKQKFLYSNWQPTDSQSGVITITPKDQLWEGDTGKLSVTFSHTLLILVEFCVFY